MIRYRILRLPDHIAAGFRNMERGQHLWWWFALVLLVGDLFFVPEIYEALAGLKPGMRRLTADETVLGKSVFGDSLPWQRIRIDEKAYLGPKQGQFFYVSGCIINGWGKMPADIFIHELVHIWQFRRVGSAYIAWALMAQQSEAGYNYGGMKALTEVRQRGGTLLDFNYEQQADIIADAWRLEQGMQLRWENRTHADRKLYASYLSDLFAS